MDVPGNPQRPLTDPYVPRFERRDEPDTGPVVRAARRVSSLEIVLGILLGVALFFLAIALLPSRARAAGADGRVAYARAPLPLTVTMTSDTALTLDSNDPVPGPRAQYVAFRVTNTSGLAVRNVSLTIGGFSGGIALTGGQLATQYVGSIPALASRTVYWFVGYPATYNIRNVLTVAASDGAGNTAGGTGVVRTLSMISAQAGGLANVSTIGPGAVVGQLIPLDVDFQFKGWKAGDTFNLQPAGNTNFPAGCFQLASSVITSADPSLALVMPVGTADRQFFRATSASSGGGSTWDVSIRYMFRYLCANASGTPLPYSNMLSGNQLKYSSSYGTGASNPGPFPTAPSPSASFVVAKSVSTPQLLAGGVVTYTVTVQNISTFAVTIDSIVDVLPAGAVFGTTTAASQVNAGNSGAVPAALSTGAIVWRANPGVSYAVAAGATLTLVYTATIPAAAGQYVNSARPYIGPTLLGTATASVTVGSADVSLTKTGPASAIAGDTLRYQLRVANAGPSAAFQVVMRDSLPAGVTFVSATRGGTYAAGIVTWPAIATLANGAQVTDEVVVLAPLVVGSVTNVGLATAAGFDPAADNNDGSGSAMRVTSQLTPPVRVTPDGLVTPLRRLPASRSSQLFTVENLGPATATYALVAGGSPVGAGTPLFLAIDSITGTGVVRTAKADSARVTLAGNASGAYTVWYTVAQGDTAVNVERLLARNVAQPAWLDTGWVEIRRAFPALNIMKSVTPNTSIHPGLDLTYTVQFANAGEFDASQVVVTDQVPPQVMFRLASLGETLPSGRTTTVTYSNNGGTTWTYVPATGGCGAPAGYDACVNRIRWTVVGGALAPASPATVTFIAQVR